MPSFQQISINYIKLSELLECKIGNSKFAKSTNDYSYKV